MDTTREAVAGFDPQAPTAWLIGGLLQYLDEGAVRKLFNRVNGLSAPNSALLYDVDGKTLLESPMLAPLVKAMADRHRRRACGRVRRQGLLTQVRTASSVPSVTSARRPFRFSFPLGKVGI